MTVSTGATLGEISQTERARKETLPTDSLPTKQRKAYLDIEDWRRRNPDRRILDAFRALNFTDGDQANYYIARKKMESSLGYVKDRRANDMIRPGDAIVRNSRAEDAPPRPSPPPPRPSPPPAAPRPAAQPTAPAAAEPEPELAEDVSIERVMGSAIMAIMVAIEPLSIVAQQRVIRAASQLVGEGERQLDAG